MCIWNMVIDDGNVFLFSYKENTKVYRGKRKSEI